MPPKFVVFDYNLQILSEMYNVLKHLPGFSFAHGDVRKLLGTVTVFVSPANSYGFMDGGIDAIYSKMFPGIEKQVQQEIAKISNEKGTLSSPMSILPVGSALITPITNANAKTDNLRLICAPTMEIPHNLKNHHDNVYYAMIAILKVCERLTTTDVVAIPGLGTGVGGLSGKESATEMLRAIYDYHSGKAISYPTGSIIQQKNNYYLVSPSFIKMK